MGQISFGVHRTERDARIRSGAGANAEPGDDLERDDRPGDGQHLLDRAVIGERIAAHYSHDVRPATGLGEQ